MPFQQTNDALDDLYGACLQPGRWPTALERMASACGGLGATVFALPATAARALTTRNLEAATAEYAATWWQYDSRAPQLAATPAGRIVTDDDLLPEPSRRRDPFYREFLRRYDLGYFAAAVVTPVPGMTLAVTVERGSAPFTKDELERFSFLSRHAAQAVAASVRLRLAEESAREAELALDGLNSGAVIFMTDHGSVRLVSDGARRFLGDGLAVAQGRVHAAFATDQPKLDRLIGSLLPGSTARYSGPVFVSRPSGRAPLVLQGLPVRRQREPWLHQFGLGDGGVVLVLHDLEPGPGRSVALDLQRIGLTPAQARIAELVGRGQPVKEAAHELGVAESTARTQLKAAYARLGIRRQSELAGLVTRLASIVAS